MTDDDPNSMGDVLNQTDSMIAVFYQCKFSRCSRYELAIMQLSNSEVTLKAMPEIGQSASSTISTWYPSLFPQPIELYHFLSITGNTSRLTPLTRVEAQQAFSYNNLMAPLVIARALRDSSRGNDTFIRSRFHFSDSFIFDKYINWMVLDLYLGGPTYTTTIGNIVWGHVPPIVSRIKNTPPLLGGDPSITEVIALNQNGTFLY